MIYDITQELFTSVVYPGDPAENFSPTLRKGDGAYRNIALLRAARHSSSIARS